MPAKNKKSASLNNKKAVPSPDEPMLPGDETVPSTDETALPGNESVASTHETTSPVDDTVLANNEPTVSVENEPVLSDDAVLLTNESSEPVEDVTPSPEETVPSTPEDDAVLSNEDTIVPVKDEPIPSEEGSGVGASPCVRPYATENAHRDADARQVTPLPQVDGEPIEDATSSPVATMLPTTETASPAEETVAETKATTSQIEERQAWRALVEPWWKATLAILPTFLITRFIMLLLSYFGGILFFVKNYAATVVSFHDIVYRWDHWDATRFATIATHGYPTKDYAAFFPLFPTLVHVFVVLTHRDVLESSMFISNVAFLGVLIVLYRFVAVEFDKGTAQRTVLYISIFPTALFFFAGYNESLFLLFTLLCFYTVRQRSWWLAGLFGLLATLTRSSGIFLALVIVWEYLRQNWPLLREEWQHKELSRMIRPLANLSAVLLIPLGLGIYSFGLYRRFHDPLAFIHAQSNWRQGLTFPLYAPLATLKKLVTLPFFSFTTAHNIIDLSAALLFAVLLAMCFVGPYRLNRSQWTFPVFGLLILITTMLYPNLPRPGGIYDPLASTQRLVLEAFVGFIILARLGCRHPKFHHVYLFIALPMLAFLTLQFMTGHWTV